MSNKKSYKSLADIRNMGGNPTQQIVKTEYTNYEEYLEAQKKVNDHYFSLPAKNCELCGYPMDYNKHQMTEWEFKWSVHEVCKNSMHGMLDRETGIARERKAVKRSADRNRH